MCNEELIRERAGDLRSERDRGLRLNNHRGRFIVSHAFLLSLSAVPPITIAGHPTISPTRAQELKGKNSTEMLGGALSVPFRRLRVLPWRKKKNKSCDTDTDDEDKGLNLTKEAGEERRRQLHLLLRLLA